jgi:hypothetical protein
MLHPVASTARAACLSLALFGALVPSAQADQSPSGRGEGQRLVAQLEGKVHRLQAALRARGYEVARGSTKLFTTDDCKYPMEVLESCLGNNPAAPYVIPVVPPWPDEYVDAGLQGMLGPLPGNTSATYRLDRREALIVVGVLPPPARYFGVQTYLFSRPGTINTSDSIYELSKSDPLMQTVLFSVVPKSPSRVLMFASLGNSTNNVVIERRVKVAFGHQRAFVVSTDAGLARELKDALAHARVSAPSEVFVEPVSASVVRLGLGAEADDFMTLIRYALPDDTDAGNDWRLQRPLAVLRVRDRHGAPTEPWPAPVYAEKTAVPESSLAESLSKLVTAVKQQWNQSYVNGVPFISLQAFLDLYGQHCMPRPMNCLGDSQDADYQASPTVYPGANDVLAVVGTLATETKNATYTSLSVNWLPYLKGLANVNDTEMKGSAGKYSASVPDADKFYVHYFARNCAGISPCTTITETMVPTGYPIKVIQRNYIVPGSERGPDPAKVLNPVSLWLDRTLLPANR